MVQSPIPPAGLISGLCRSLWLALIAIGPLAQAVAAQDKPPPAIAPEAKSAAAVTPAVNTTLINDLLRQQSPAFKMWDVGLQLRARYDFKENAGSDGKYAAEDFMRTPPAGKFNDNNFLLLREKIHLGFSPRPWVTAYVEGRDSSVTGDRRDPNPGADQMDLHQAYLQLGSPAVFPLQLKVGRQEMAYGDERQVGTSDWANLDRSFDAMKLRFETSGNWVDVFVSRVVMPDDHNFNMPNDYDYFSGVYGSTRTLLPWQETQLYFLARNASPQATIKDPGWLTSPPSAEDIYTLGLRIKSLPEHFQGFDYYAELAGQFGSINPSGNRHLEHEGFMSATGGGYTWREAYGTPRLGLEYCFASGDHNPNDNVNQRYEPMFPSGHPLIGYMDVVGMRNLHDLRALTSMKPTTSLLVSLDYHLFWLADTHDYFYPENGPGRNNAANDYGLHPEYNPFLGSEMDLDLTYKLASWASIRGGYAHFFTGSYINSSLAKSGGAVDADWLYLQTMLKF